jgi:hypothetical protein
VENVLTFYALKRVPPVLYWYWDSNNNIIFRIKLNKLKIVYNSWDYGAR